MNEINLTKENGLITEDESMNKDIYKNKGLDILLCLLHGPQSIDIIAKEIDMPVFSVRLFIERLLRHDVIKISDKKIINGKIVKFYKLSEKDINFLSKIDKDENEKAFIEYAAKYYSDLATNIFKNINIVEGKPGMAKAIYIKASNEQIKEFIKDLNELFEKYNNIEDVSEENIYAYLGMVSSYDQQNEL